MNHGFRSPILLVVMAVFVVSSFADVLTQHNDSSRTGQNREETTLNTGNVNVSDFGKLFTVSVSGNIFAQPLYVSNLSIGSQGHVVYVATAANNVYAIDADTGKILWTVGPNVLGTPVPSQDICVTDEAACPYTDTIPVIGIIATPVIDAATDTLYLVADSKDSSGNYHFKLHALSLTTGTEKFGEPAEITATGLRQLTEMCRPGLLLANGMVYLAMGSVGDFPSWHGYVMAYDAGSLQQVAVYNSTPQHNNVGGAGIWQAGNGLVADANGDVYVVTSNGNFDVNTGGQDYGSAYLKLNGSTLSVMDYFVPYNQASLNPESDNVDLGSGGPLLIPKIVSGQEVTGTLLAGTGKDAVLRVVDTTNMGKYNPNTNNNVQNILAATNPPVLGSPVYWDSPSLGQVIYLWGLNDVLKAWAFNGTNLSTSPVAKGTIKGAPSDAAALSISANGSTADTGILWATRPISGASNPGPTAGILYAFDGSSLSELWDSQQNSARDALGNWAKFNPPTIGNGKVYVATFSGQLVVYGLNPPGSQQISFVQTPTNYVPPQTATSSMTVPFQTAQTQGNLNVVAVGFNDTTTTVLSVTDSDGAPELVEG
jgi:outer membrane protein assembly factor BamB